MEILNIENLSFKYSGSKENALCDISLSVSEGDFVLISGLSGSGKSTLLRLLKPEVAPFGEKSGNISINGKVGIVTQDAENQIVSDTVWHNIAFWLENMGVSSNEIRARSAEIAEFFDLTSIYTKKTAELSGGEKQLVNLASVMAASPDILLLDEPTSQLDPIAARRFIDIVKRLNRETALTVIISEHRTEELFNNADKICIMEEGSLYNLGSCKDICENESSLKRAASFLPVPMKIYYSLGIKDKCPTTVRECRDFLSAHFKCGIQSIECEKQGEKKDALTVKNVYFRYEKNSPDVLHDFSITAHFSEVLTILGGNGSGKSTLLSLMGGTKKPYYGKIKLNAKKCALLPQNVKTVFTKEILSEDLALVSKDFDEIADFLKITHLLNRNPYDLSGGEAQRAALAKLLLLNPDVLCLDEPTKGIDAEGKKYIIKLLRHLANEGK
ncbi:MAG: ATP-binding cassette domain-containing protein, partial [Clostridia bacterium]|nr:ATP-binding cassette domain-containing protein [Clostridia bacterium]